MSVVTNRTVSDEFCGLCSAKVCLKRRSRLEFNLGLNLVEKAE
jgi:hypothetical protein